jgi:hypothetical protein
MRKPAFGACMKLFSQSCFFSSSETIPRQRKIVAEEYVSNYRYHSHPSSTRSLLIDSRQPIPELPRRTVPRRRQDKTTPFLDRRDLLVTQPPRSNITKYRGAKSLNFVPYAKPHSQATTTRLELLDGRAAIHCWLSFLHTLKRV